ncbi:hypothetical protein BDV95DRAFT_62478 [Massariosphaeria phaeospora]|uniref:Uncharacterized protein n=1 Tax=Massariosphaeria phaeospora TaxID=100035 RepID=A0A7C8M8S5_9PLEO|nr:hypothetical protein BDV95DRAFT_62478 [Massariosphaeria phaeospora]
METLIPAKTQPALIATIHYKQHLLFTEEVVRHLIFKASRKPMVAWAFLLGHTPGRLMSGMGAYNTYPLVPITPSFDQVTCKMHGGSRPSQYPLAAAQIVGLGDARIYQRHGSARSKIPRAPLPQKMFAKWRPDIQLWRRRKVETHNGPTWSRNYLIPRTGPIAECFVMGTDPSRPYSAVEGCWYVGSCVDAAPRGILSSSRPHQDFAP